MKETKHGNLDDNEKDQLRKYEKKRKKAICDNLDDEQKQHVRIEDIERKQIGITLMLMNNNS